MQQTVDALCICIYHRLVARERHQLVYRHIMREASADLLVLLIRAMRRPPIVERAAGTALTLLFYNKVSLNVSESLHYLKAL